MTEKQLLNNNNDKPLVRFKLSRAFVVSLFASVLVRYYWPKCRVVVESSAGETASYFQLETRHMPNYLRPEKNTTLMEPKIWERKGTVCQSDTQSICISLISGVIMKANKATFQKVGCLFHFLFLKKIQFQFQFWLNIFSTNVNETFEIDTVPQQTIPGSRG